MTPATDASETTNKARSPGGTAPTAAAGPTFYLGAHQPHWLRLAGFPLFVSHRQLARRSLRPAAGRWALDSGGFTELSMHGQWVTPAAAYAEAVAGYAERVGGLDFAAPQDWMCEPQMISRTGLSVREHQDRTVANYLELRALAPDLPFIPVVQGLATGGLPRLPGPVRVGRGRPGRAVAGRAGIGVPPPVHSRDRGHRGRPGPPRATAARILCQDRRTPPVRPLAGIGRLHGMELRRAPRTLAARLHRTQELRELPGLRHRVAVPGTGPPRGPRAAGQPVRRLDAGACRMTALTGVSLFAGIGGFDLAMRRAGIEVAASVEIDPACRAVLARHFPETTLYDDVTEVTGDHLRTVGLVPGRGVLTAGWPCQGNSVAGRRCGMADPHSGLWRHVVRLLAEARPLWFVGENVPGLHGINVGRDFHTVLRDLDDLGYGVAWRVLDAQFFGVPQRRRRVFLAGCLGDGTAPVEVLLEPEGGGWHPSPVGETGPGAAARAGGHAGSHRTEGDSGLAPAVSTLQGGGRRGYRLDAEAAAGGHLVPVPTAVAGTPRTRPRPGSADPGAVTIAHTVTAREGKGPDSDATSGFIVAHTLTADGADASEDGTGRGTPLVPVFAPLTAGTPAGDGV